MVDSIPLVAIQHILLRSMSDISETTLKILPVFILPRM